LNLTSGSFGAVKISDILILLCVMSVSNNYFYFVVSLLYSLNLKKQAIS
jgi:hypothetical protein